jgi:tellurite resistance protein
MATESNIPLPKQHLLAIVVCMVSTAQVDGIRPEETALIRKFYDESRTADMPSFDDIKSSEVEIKSALQMVQGDAGFSEQLILMCVMTGYADGKLTAAELKHVSAMAEQLGLSSGHLDALLTQVKDTLMGALSHLPDPESVAALRQAM